VNPGFPSYGEDFSFEIKEYTNANFDVPAGPENRADTAGEVIYLSVEAKKLDDDAKFAVTECQVVDGEHKMSVMNAGAETDATCAFDYIDFKASYDQEQNRFNFQHKLFLLQTMENGESNFKLVCTVEVCAKNALDSKCNKAAGVCIDELEEEDKSVAQESYFCDSACDADSEKCEYSDGVVQCVKKIQGCACNIKTQTCGEECQSAFIDNLATEGLMMDACADGWVFSMFESDDNSVGWLSHCVKACACNSKIQTCGEECESGNVEVATGCAEGWIKGIFDSGDDSVGWIVHCEEELQPCACNIQTQTCGDECESGTVDREGCADGWLASMFESDDNSVGWVAHCVKACACNSKTQTCGEECESAALEMIFVEKPDACADGWFIKSDDDNNVGSFYCAASQE